MRQIEETQTKWQSAIHDEFTRTSYDMMNNLYSVKKLPRQKTQTHMFHIDQIFLLWQVYKLLWMYSRWVSLAQKMQDKCHLIKTSCCHPQSFYHPVASLWSQTRSGQPSNWWVSDFLCRTIQQWNDPDWHCWEIALSLPNRSKHLGMIEALNLMIFSANSTNVRMIKQFIRIQHQSNFCFIILTSLTSLCYKAWTCGRSKGSSTIGGFCIFWGCRTYDHLR